MADPDDATVPQHTSLITPIPLGGTLCSFAILNVTHRALVGVGLRQIWLAIPVRLLAHSVAVWLTRQDPRWMDVLKRHLKEKVYYQA